MKLASSAFLPFGIMVILLLNGCAPIQTPVLPEPSEISTPHPTSTAQLMNAPALSPEGQYTIAEVEKLAGLDVREPSYLPKGVSLDFATYQATPSPSVTLHFKIVHEQYGDMGKFFQIMQEPQIEAPPDTISCGEFTDGCEMLQLSDLSVVYRLTTAGTEGMDWYTDGFSFRLLRTAGEPNKIYKDELMKVVDSMK